MGGRLSFQSAAEFTAQTSPASYFNGDFAARLKSGFFSRAEEVTESSEWADFQSVSVSFS